MEKSLLNKWCEIATCRIRFGPDRKKVTNELMGHLEDRRDALMEQGMDEREATEKALEAMGDAKEIAPQLGAIHRPFWGYALRVCKIALIVLLCLGILPIWNYFKDLKLQETPDLRQFNIYDSTSYGGDTGRTLLHLSHPNKSFASDGNTFTLTDVAVCSSNSEYYGANFTQLYVRIRQNSLLPWTEHDEYFDNNFSTITAWFFARDSLGNVYKPFMELSAQNSPRLYTYGVQSDIFTFTHECWINEFPAEAEWVDICYERDGRNFSLRIYLTGGERG